MSKIVNIQIECPQCGKQYVAKVFRTLWGDGCNADTFETRLKDNTEEVKLEMSAPNRAGILTPVNNQTAGEDILMLLMPVMLNS